MRGAVFCIAAFFLLASCGPAQLAEYSSSNQKIDSSIVSNSLDSIISPYRTRMQAEMMEVIGYSDSNLVSYAPESPLSNFVADVVYERGMEYAQSNNLPAGPGNTFCMLNFGGIRSAINKGEITIATIYELMPFDNTIVIVELMRPALPDLLGAMYQSKGQPVANARVQLSEEQSTIEIGADRQVHWEDNFFVITSDYLANGGDKMDFFKRHAYRWDTGILIRDVLLDYIKRTKNIQYTPVEGRVVL